MNEEGRSDESRAESLAGMIENRRWLHRSHPFPHIVAHDVFASRFYEQLSGHVAQLLSAGLSDVPSATQFSRGMRGYDAYGIGITEDLGPPLTIFLSPAWRDLMCGLFAVERTPYVFAGAHHHAPGSGDGFIHTDFNPVWFPRAVGGAIQIPRVELC